VPGIWLVGEGAGGRAGDCRGASASADVWFF
jgi:hypothetical protein